MSTRQNKKEKIPSHIKYKAMSEFQKLRRMQEASENGYVKCISCGAVMKWQDAQGGHFISRRILATEIEPDNVHAQCSYCNCILKGNYTSYSYYLKKRIGEKRTERLILMEQAYKGDEDALEALSEEDRLNVIESHKKHSDRWWYDKYKEFKEKINEELNRLS